MDKLGLTSKEIKEIYIQNINDTYTLNLAVCMLENYDELLDIVLKLKEERKELYTYTPENGFRKVDEDE